MTVRITTRTTTIKRLAKLAWLFLLMLVISSTVAGQDDLSESTQTPKTVPIQSVELAVVEPEAAEKNENAPTFSDPISQTWHIGVEVSAGDGVCSGLIATTPIPIDWNEQTVKIVSQTKPANSRISFRNINSTVKQMVVSIRSLRANETAKAYVVVEVQKRHTIEPSDPSKLRFATKTEIRSMRKYLLPSPYIESKDKKVVALAKEIGDATQTPYKQVRSVFDWVKENVEYKFDTKIKSCISAIDDKVGDCEEMSSLFIAICRAKGIPARAVWIPGHTYPEFYLVDQSGAGHWFPAQVAGGNNDFGRMPEDRPILQKGDNFRVVGLKGMQRYVQPTLTARNASGSPQLKWILEKQETDKE